MTNSTMNIIDIIWKTKKENFHEKNIARQIYPSYMRICKGGEEENIKEPEKSFQSQWVVHRLLKHSSTSWTCHHQQTHRWSQCLLGTLLSEPEKIKLQTLNKLEPWGSKGIALIFWWLDNVWKTLFKC